MLKAVLNFNKSSTSFEFSKIRFDDDNKYRKDQLKKHVKKNSEQIQEDIVNQRKLKADLSKQLTAFYENPKLLSSKPIGEENIKKKILMRNPALDYTCYNCKLKKANHFVKELNLPDVIEQTDDSFVYENDIEIRSNEGLLVGGGNGDNQDKISIEISRKLQNVQHGDFIEQIIFDPQLGIVKREIHYGIIDCLTTYALKKQFEEKTGYFNSVRPEIYAERFINTMKKVFQ